MKVQMSRERLEEKLLEYIKHGGDSEEETMIRMLLAVMDSKPVATLDVQSGRPDGNKFALAYSSAAHKLPDDVYYLHTAPPVPECDELLAALKQYEQAFDEMFTQCCSNPIYDSWGRKVSGITTLNDAHYMAEKAIARATMQLFGISEQLKAESVTVATVPPHIYRELVNQLRDTAVKYQGCQQLREQLSATLRTVITPAAPEQEV